MFIGAGYMYMIPFNVSIHNLQQLSSSIDDTNV